MPQNRFWTTRIRYEFAREAILHYWRGISIWQYSRIIGIKDQHQEDFQDAMGCYCMGGEL